MPSIYYVQSRKPERTDSMKRSFNERGIEEPNLFLEFCEGLSIPVKESHDGIYVVEFPDDKETSKKLSRLETSILVNQIHSTN